MSDLSAIIATTGASLYDTEIANENSRAIYRVYITKPGGVSLDDCEAVSRLISPIFDVEPPISGEYFLEVSSPGLERKLSETKHFLASIGELVKISLNDKSKIEGELVNASESEIAIKSGDGNEIKISLSDIKKARTYIKW